jgi:hypothetical protein
MTAIPIAPVRANFVCGWTGPVPGFGPSDLFGKPGCGHVYVSTLPHISVRLPRCPKCGCWRAGLVSVLEPVAD